MSSLSRLERRSRVVALAEAHEAGGKARGLARLIELGLDVPPGFVVVDAQRVVDAEAVRAALSRLGPEPVAVRSSADVEDGEARSWAGQFVTTLGVSGAERVLEAIAACVVSRDDALARAYGAGANSSDNHSALSGVEGRTHASSNASNLSGVEGRTHASSNASNLSGVEGRTHAPASASNLSGVEGRTHASASASNTSALSGVEGRTHAPASASNTSALSGVEGRTHTPSSSRDAALRLRSGLSAGSHEVAGSREVEGPTQSPSGLSVGSRTAARMHVVVQRMVTPRAAGVLFTADPVSGRRDRIVIEAVAGHGEALVSGRARAERYLTDLRGVLVSSDLPDGTRLLDDAALSSLAAQALSAARKLGAPLDLEWAIDGAERVWWLQARPITTLGPDVALDSPAYDDHVYTRANVGEMLPGVVTPLTLSVFGPALEAALSGLVRAIGADHASVPDQPFICSFDGQLFFDLTRVYVMGSAMIGASKEDVDLSIAGRPVGIGVAPPPLPLWRRVINGARYGAMLLGVGGEVDAAAERLSPLGRLPLGDARAVVKWFESARAWVDEGWIVHLRSSSASGSLCSALLQVFSQRGPLEPAHFAAVSAVLEGVEDAESALLLDDVLALADLMRADAEGRAILDGGDDAHLLHWLTEAAPPRVRLAWRELRARHGHRSIRESELRVPEWAHDPTELLALMRQARPVDAETVHARHPDSAPRPFGVRAALWAMVPHARRAVAMRERSKSLAVRRHVELKRAYRQLGAHLVAGGRLPNEDALYFLTHDELMRLVARADPQLADLAARRRALFDERQSVRLPELAKGRPVVEHHEAGDEGELRGTPVARGRVRGRVRVARSFSEAQALQPGEVLVVPHIDVGWTPFFRVAGGVVTEIGSPLSHAAVVAREVGIPTLVNVNDATRRLTTGMLVDLDGARGVIDIVPE